MPSDADFLLAMLRETPNEFVSQAEILRRSQAERGCGLTVHSRIADLRRRGYNIPPALCLRAEDGRVVSYYRILEPPLREAGSVVSSFSLGSDGESGFSERGAPLTKGEPSPSKLPPVSVGFRGSPSVSGEALARPDEVCGTKDPPRESEPEGPRPLVLFSVTRRPPWA
jgi:hypothetical protein